MPSLTSTGVGSGLDVNSVVTSLMALERRPLQLLQGRAGEVQTRLSAYGSLQSQLAALADVASRLAEPSAWQPLRVESSSAEAVAAVPLPAQPGAAAAPPPAALTRLRLEVQQLAQGQALASPAYAGGTSTVGTGELRIELGSLGPAGFAPGPAAALRISVSAANASLAGVRDAINAAGAAASVTAGITASIVGSGGEARLVLRGPEGAASVMRITATATDGQSQDAAGLSALAWDPAAAPVPGALAEVQVARDALYTLDGLALRSPRNQIDGAVEGVRLTLRQVTTAPVTLGVSADASALRKNIHDFASAYNGLVRLLQQQTLADPGGKNRGTLQGDSAPLGLLSQLRAMARSAVPGSEGAGAGSGAAASLNLAALGLEAQRDGTLVVQEARLASALAQPALLARMFAAAPAAPAAPAVADPASGGLALRLKAWARRATGEDGAITQRLQGLRGTLDRNQKAQDTAQDRLARTEARLRAQYQRLDSDMSGLNARMSQMRASLGLN